MYCPCCGSEILSNQKFCRSCGMETQSVSESVAEYLRLDSADGSLGRSVVSAKQRQKELGRRGTIVMLGGAALLILTMVCFLITLGLGQVFGFDPGFFGLILPWVVAISMTTMITGIGIGVYPRLKKELPAPYRAGPLSLSAAESRPDCRPHRYPNLFRASLNTPHAH